LTGSGISLQNYHIQAASYSSGPWTTIGTVQAASNGLISYTDTVFIVTNTSGQGYYRLSQ
jgi:hypothetical protein